MSNRAVLEVIALDEEDAVAAQTGGADRLELVTDMAADGLTPSRTGFAAIRAAVDIPLRVMLRPPPGVAARGPAGGGAPGWRGAWAARPHHSAQSRAPPAFARSMTAWRWA
ncbi:copper homeostasis protein CutC, partial [Streptomyces sp. NPDC059556]|uniref:copper homeostasis protein CutC n=1 Tax=Streptomyces sp. NPDC059556 TaxID=3346863 RepID=UPI00368BC217